MSDAPRIPTVKLTVLQGEEILSEHTYEVTPITIGSGEGAVLCLDNTSLAELHAVLNIVEDGSVQLLDLGSAAGVILNGARLTSNTEVNTNDIFQLGDLTFRIEIDAAEKTVPLVDLRPSTPAQAADAQAEAPAAQAEAQTEAPAPAEHEAPHHAAPAQAEDEAGYAGLATIGSSETRTTEDLIDYILSGGHSQLGVDTKAAKVLEVNQIWGNSLLSTKYFKKDASVTIGDETGNLWYFLGIRLGWVPNWAVAPLRVSPMLWNEIEDVWVDDFYAAHEHLPGGKGDYTIFKGDGKAFTARLHENWSGYMVRDGEQLSIEALLSSGAARKEGDSILVPLADDDGLYIDAGNTSYLARLTHPSKALVVSRDEKFDYPFLATLLFFSLAGLVLVFIMAINPPSLRTGADSALDEELIVELVRPEPTKKPDDGNKDAGEGKKAKHDEGSVGKQDSKMKEAKGNKREVKQAEIDREVAENAGLLSALDDATAGGSLGGGGLSSALTGGIGGLIGARGTQIGAGGLGSRGAGLGGGGTAEGLGGLGNKGNGLGRSGNGYGRGDFGTGDGGASRAKSVTGDPIVMGALDRALIDAVIKRKMNQIRYCYQRELQRDPQLAGKLVIQFTIAGDGSVSKASAKSSTVGSSAVSECVVNRFYSMKFPEPKGGGIVIVSYPFIFSPG